MFADLHLHTTASDGLETPFKIVEMAKKMGFKCISITDHDTVDGLSEAQKAAEQLGIELIPGIELSTLFEGKEVHILGYCIDPNNQMLKDLLSKFIESRKKRARKIVEKLNELGVDVSMSRVEEIAKGEFVGRPHIARAMMEKGYVSSLSEAFTKDYLGNGGRAYVERYKLYTHEAINFIKQIGAVAVLAHPGIDTVGGRLTHYEIEQIIEMGIEGIEVFYPEHDAAQTRFYKNLAQTHNLVITGGSDYHGDKETDLKVGSIKLPYKHVEALKARCKDKKTEN